MKRLLGHASSRSGFSLIELMIASTILFVILLGVMTAVYQENRALGSQARMGFGESRLQAVVSRIENELLYAQGSVPGAWLTANLGTGGGGNVQVDTTRGFPDRGFLLVDRGTVGAEILQYETFDSAADTFDTLTRGLFGTPDSGHFDGAQVFWASEAVPIEDQVAPTPDEYEGIAQEILGPVYFRGYGAGFSFRLPTDPAGGSEFIVDGEIQWGATVGGQPLLSGWSCFYFDPVGVLDEAVRNQDFNLDGDRVDVYDLGSIRWRSWDSDDATVEATDIALCPPIIMQEQMNWGSDLDNDGSQDPVFLWSPDAGTLHIRLLALVGEVKERAVTNRAETVIYLRNGADN